MVRGGSSATGRAGPDARCTVRATRARTGSGGGSGRGTSAQSRSEWTRISYRAPHRGQPRWFEKGGSVVTATGSASISAASSIACERAAVFEAPERNVGIGKSGRVRRRGGGSDRQGYV